MIIIKKSEVIEGTMDISLNGSAEEIAQEYVALTLKLNDTYPIILDRAQWYLDDIAKLRKEVNNE